MINRYLDDIDTESYEESVYAREQALPDMDHLKDHLQGVLNAIYVDGDIQQLENCLEEVLCVVGMDLPEDSPKIQRKQLSKDLMWELGYQRGILDAKGEK